MQGEQRLSFFCDFKMRGRKATSATRDVEEKKTESFYPHNIQADGCVFPNLLQIVQQYSK